MTGKKGETPSNEALMPEQDAMFRERAMQPLFSFLEFFQLLAFVLAFYAAWRGLGYLPNRVEQGEVTSKLHLDAVDLDPQGFKGLSLAGAWELGSPDPRFGGFSALVVHGGDLLALTDRGAVASFAKPKLQRASSVTMRDLPDGPGNKNHIWNRDSEALARDPLGRGWWVAFEVRHELWLYDPSFTRGLKRVRLGARRWPLNKGSEGLIALPGPELMMFLETSGRLFRMSGSKAVAEGIAEQGPGVSDATLLPDGRAALLARTIGLTGFRNVLAILEPARQGFAVRERFDLPTGVLTNLEGVAAEAQPDGSTRLWMISDDNFQRPLRTLLLAVDLPPKRMGG